MTNHTIRADITIFGYGSITNLIINKLSSQGKKILCVTNNSQKYIPKFTLGTVQFVTRSEIVRLRLSTEAMLFTWRNLDTLQPENSGLLKWLESDHSETSKTIFLSSSSVYKDSPLPVNELDLNLGQLVENNSKYLLEIALADLGKIKRISHTNLRISNVYGKNLDYGFISDIIKSSQSRKIINIFDDLSVKRDYIYVEDLVYAVCKILDLDVETKNLNVSTGIGTSIQQLLLICELCGLDIKDRINLIESSTYKKVSILDCTRLSNLIKWEPVSIKTGISRIMSI
jgi:nucleoside-diphosphate-sugar epimerase